jgi:FMN phosphatase YigB (HAD superfamily)
MQTHLIFDLGGTLIFDPFDEVMRRFATLPLRRELMEALADDQIDKFLEQWRIENREYNFPFASHFLQEEPWIARASRTFYRSGAIPDKKSFPLWTAKVLQAYRMAAFEAIREQSHLPELRDALGIAKQMGFRLSVASNDRYFATSAMLEAAGVLDMFDLVATSEELSFDIPGAEKPSAKFFEALQSRIGLDFETSNTFYVGDDETRDIISTRNLPIRSIRFFGNKSQSKSWLDNPGTTAASFAFEKYADLSDIIKSRKLEK